jgi:hypothetical protein
MTMKLVDVGITLVQGWCAANVRMATNVSQLNMNRTRTLTVVDHAGIVTPPLALSTLSGESVQ